MTESAVQEPEKTETETTAIDRPLNRTQAMTFGIAPQNFDQAWRMADLFAKSALVPKSYQNKPEDILVAMAYGAEIGLAPMAALQSIAVINGKPGVYGDGFLAVIQSTPAYVKHAEYYRLDSGEIVKSLQQADYAKDETTAVAMFWRKGIADAFVGEFSIGDAKRAKLWGREGPWMNYPGRMLKFRARGFAGRDAFAAELRGITTAEEIRDTPAEEPYVDAPIVEPVRRSEKAAAAVAAPVTTSNAESTSDPAPQTPPVSSEPQKAAASEAAKDRPAGQVVKSLRITDTQVVSGRDGKPGHYEVHADRGEAGKVGQTIVFVTRDEQLYKMAASCEGSDARFDLTWHEQRAETTKKVVKVLTGLTAAD